MSTHLQSDSLKYTESICASSVLYLHPTAQNHSAYVGSALDEHWMVVP